MLLWRRTVNMLTILLEQCPYWRAGLSKIWFVSFLKDTLVTCGTNLSLQGLLLKPIQQFPQYILILQVCWFICLSLCVYNIPQCDQDFLKCTPSSHPDQMPLQMALTKLEGIAEHLNETKRQREQTTIVHYLNTISGLPFVSVQLLNYEYTLWLVVA